jgi:hypothetical protein
VVDLDAGKVLGGMMEALGRHPDGTKS